MTGTPEAAAQLDRAIDDLLRGTSRWEAPEVDGQLLVTARLVWETLPRFHPRFGFSEALSRRLASAGQPADASRRTDPSEPDAARRTGAAHPDARRLDEREVGTIVPFERPARGAGGEPPEARFGGRTSSRRLGIVVAGGAIASGVSLAISIAGAMLLRRRRSRGSRGLA